MQYSTTWVITLQISYAWGTGCYWSPSIFCRTTRCHGLYCERLARGVYAACLCGSYERKSGDRQGVGVRGGDLWIELPSWSSGIGWLVDTLGGFQYKIQTHLCLILICFLFTTSCFRIHTLIPLELSASIQQHTFLHRGSCGITLCRRQTFLSWLKQLVHGSSAKHFLPTPRSAAVGSATPHPHR